MTTFTELGLLQFQIDHYTERLKKERSVPNEKKNIPAIAYLRSQLWSLTVRWRALNN